jgi:2-hydroxy-6-oxonona-2,4-dienedioate hydrolase
MLNYKKYGRGKNHKNLVLLHGFAGGLDYWLPLVVGLQHGFDIVAFDLPGFAGSANIPAPDTIAGYASAVVAAMDELGIKKTALLGFSMGGMIAQQVALDYPDRIETLVLYGSAARGDLPHRFESWDAAISRIERDGVEALVHKTSSTWFVEGESHPYFPMAREAGRGANKESCVIAMRAIQKWSSIERLSELKIPTLVIVGDKDRSTTPGDSVVLWENIAGSQFCVIPGSAHGTHAEKPDLFNKVVCDFLVEHMTADSIAS